MRITRRTWTATPERPTNVTNCKHNEKCICPKKVQIPLRTTNGRTVVAHLTPAQAEVYAAQIAAAAAWARARF